MLVPDTINTPGFAPEIVRVAAVVPDEIRED